MTSGGFSFFPGFQDKISSFRRKTKKKKEEEEETEDSAARSFPGRYSGLASHGFEVGPDKGYHPGGMLSSP